MKWISFRFLVLPLMTILLLGSAPSVRAIALQDSSGHGRVNDDNEKKRKKDQVPEGSTGAILVLAAGILGGGMLLWRRKKGASAA